MIAGNVTVTAEAVHTHKDSYRIAMLSVVSVRRPLLPVGVLSCVGSLAFAARFHDLLYSREIVTLAIATTLAAGVGLSVGQLTFLSRDLKGTHQSSAVWGTYGHLNRLRRRIMAARIALKSEVSS